MVSFLGLLLPLLAACGSTFLLISSSLGDGWVPFAVDPQKAKNVVEEAVNVVAFCSSFLVGDFFSFHKFNLVPLSKGISNPHNEIPHSCLASHLLHPSRQNL